VLISRLITREIELFPFRVICDDMRFSKQNGKVHPDEMSTKISSFASKILDTQKKLKKIKMVKFRSNTAGQTGLVVSRNYLDSRSDLFFLRVDP
jgi:hypothetical protein